MIPTLGNNDNKYHDEATRPEDKKEFYKFLFDEWMTKMQGNKALAKDPEIKKTFMEGAYYRYDVTDRISVLALNTMYFMFNDDDESSDKVITKEGTQQLKWIEEQFKNAGDRKFILTCHVYAGSRWKGKQLFKTQRNEEYFALLRKYQSKVLIEVFAHDHLADLRYHTTDLGAIFPRISDDATLPKYFHNMFIAPGIAPNKG